jgi:hypothetical protein
MVVAALNRLMSSPATIARVIGVLVLIVHISIMTYNMIKKRHGISVSECIKDFICKKTDALLFPFLLILVAWILPLKPESDYALVEYPRAIPFIMGIAVTFALGTLLPSFLDIAERGLTTENQWSELEGIPGGGGYLSGGYLIGLIERTLFFVAFYYEQPLLIGGILTFKVAAKWEAWKNIIQVPQKHLNGFPNGAYRYFIFRRRWGGKLFNRFVVGTFSNILFALVGYGFYRWFLIVLDP